MQLLENPGLLFNKFKQNGSLEIMFHYPDEESIKMLNAFFSIMLANNDKIYLLETIITIIREIILNAMKANAKRLYCELNKLDIHNHEVYTKIMEKFKEEVIGNTAIIQDELNTSEYYIKLELKKENDGIEIEVSNNTLILPEELERITLRLSKAREVTSFADVYDDIYDDSEGAGLGIVLSVLLLKNAGLPIEEFQILTREKETVSRLYIPAQLEPHPFKTKILDQINSLIDVLPTFPDNILQLQELCHDREANIDNIAALIYKDPSLSSQILKLSNSAGFFPSKKVDNITTAVMTIGLKNLEAMLIITAAKNIMDKRFIKFEQIWTHCNMTAFIARSLAKKFNNHVKQENIYLAGLLHDIGKIILLSVDQEMNNWLTDLFKNRKTRTSTVLEEITIGISHAEIGALISKKWNFPTFLTEVINNHHAPLNSSDENRELTFIVYLANIICGLESHRYNYYFIEQEVLDYFHINNDADFAKLSSELLKEYSEQATLLGL